MLFTTTTINIVSLCVCVSVFESLKPPFKILNSSVLCQYHVTICIHDYRWSPFLKATNLCHIKMKAEVSSCKRENTQSFSISLYIILLNTNTVCVCVCLVCVCVYSGYKQSRLPPLPFSLSHWGIPHVRLDSYQAIAHCSILKKWTIKI